MSQPSLYDFPNAFEVVMRREKNVLDRELATIRALLRQHGIEMGRVLELACGTCAHGIPLAQMGYEVTGIDLAQPMLDAAQRSASEAGIHIETVHGNVVDFALQGERFDAAVFLFETFEVITAYEDLVRHFSAVRRHVRQSGLYIVDLSASRHGVGTSQGEWGRRTLPIDGGRIETWMEEFPGDWVAGTSHLVLHCQIEKDGQVWHTVDEWRLRVYSPWGFGVLVRGLPGWRLEGFTSWRAPETDFQEDDHYFAVLVATPLDE